MTWTLVFQIALITAIVMGGIWAFCYIIVRTADMPPKRPKPKAKDGRPVCTDGYCQAFSWDYCTGGRCKYHCEIYCHCGKGEDALRTIAKANRKG